MSRTIEVCIVMSESGDYIVARDEETASDLADEELDEDEPRRFVTLKIKLAAPTDDAITSQTFEFALD